MSRIGLYLIFLLIGGLNLQGLTRYGMTQAIVDPVVNGPRFGCYSHARMLVCSLVCSYARSYARMYTCLLRATDPNVGPVSFQVSSRRKLVLQTSVV